MNHFETNSTRIPKSADAYDSIFKKEKGIIQYKHLDHGERFLIFLKDYQQALEADIEEGSEEEGKVLNYDKVFKEYKKRLKSSLEDSFKNTEFTFGKYKGVTIHNVIQEDGSYCKWVAYEISSNKRGETRMLELYYWASGESATRIAASDSDSSGRKRKSKKSQSGKKGKRKGKHTSNSKFNFSWKLRWLLSCFQQSHKAWCQIAK